MREMKDSGVQWIGEIPADWSLYKIKYLGQYINGFPFKPDDWGETGKPIIRIQDLTGSNKNPNYYSGELDKKYLISDGDILVSWAATLDAFEWNKGEGWLNQHIFKAVPNGALVNKSYFIWLLKTAMRYMNDDNKHGIVMQHITLPVFNNFVVPLPSIEKQRNIADALQDDMRKVDTLIANVQAQIEKLRAYKQSVITVVVTKGLDPTVPMKDSGVEWIGEIPTHWEITRKLAFVTTEGISYGIVKLFDPDDVNGVKVLRCSDVLEGWIKPDNIRTVTQKVSNEYARTILSGGEVVVNVRGSLGGCAVVPEEMAGYNIAREVAKITLSNRMCNRYVMYYLLSRCFVEYRTSHLSGSVYVGLNIELLSSCPLPNPELTEQKAIADYLDEKCFQIDRLIALKQSKIEKLEQYKKSLIYEYVTGKKEVS